MIARMRDDGALRERIAKARGWNPETLRQLALEGHLGWHDGKLAFIYDTGVKLRWREAGSASFGGYSASPGSGGAHI